MPDQAGDTVQENDEKRCTDRLFHISPPKNTKAGTIRNPPPTPRNPVNIPTPRPARTALGQMCLYIFSLVTCLRRQIIEAATINIKTRKDQEQSLGRYQFGQGRSDERSDDAGDAEEQSAGKIDIVFPPVKKCP